MKPTLFAALFAALFIAQANAAPDTLALESKRGWQPGKGQVVPVQFWGHGGYTWAYFTFRKRIVPAAKSPFEPFNLDKARTKTSLPLTIESLLHLDSKGRPKPDLVRKKVVTTFAVGPTF